MPGHAHNYYLNVAAETGFLGLLAYLWSQAFPANWRAVRRATAGPWLALGVLGVLVHLSVRNLLNNCSYAMLAGCHLARSATRRLFLETS